MTSTMSMPHSVFAAPTASFFTPSPSISTLHYSPTHAVSKRKRAVDADESTSDSSSDEDRWPSAAVPATTRTAHGSPSHPRPVKRVRRDLVGGYDDHSNASVAGQAGFRNAGMENGFAELSLMSGLDAVTGWSRGVAPQTAAPQVQAGAHDVKMASRSWYEPEKDRIVVFDLNDSDAESDTGDSHGPPSPDAPNTPSAYSYKDSSGAYSISQKYLDRIPAWPYRQPEVAPLVDSTTNPGALVLYKTPAFTAQHAGVMDEMDDANDTDDGRGLYASIEEVDDDEDTQMMEVDETP